MSQADESGATPEQDEEKPAGRRGLILVSTAVVVVLAVAAVVVYLLVGGDDGTENAGGTDVPTITGSPAPTTETTPTTSQPAASTPVPSSAAPPAEGDPAEAKSVAEEAANAISSGDVTTIAALSCDPESVPEEGSYPADAKVEVVGEPQINGDTATIDLRLTIAGTEPTIVPMPLTKQDGRWCVP